MQGKAAADRGASSRNTLIGLGDVHTAVARTTSAEVCEDMYEVMFPGRHAPRQSSGRWHASLRSHVPQDVCS